MAALATGHYRSVISTQVDLDFVEDHVTVLRSESGDPARPFANLLPLVSVMVERGNTAIGGGFILNPDGWRCRMLEPLDFDLIAEVFVLPRNVQLAPAHDTVLDRLTWCSIEGPGAIR